MLRVEKEVKSIAKEQAKQYGGDETNWVPYVLGGPVAGLLMNNTTTGKKLAQKIGATPGGLKGFFKDTPASIGQYDYFNPAQNRVSDFLGQQGLQGLFPNNPEIQNLINQEVGQQNQPNGMNQLQPQNAGYGQVQNPQQQMPQGYDLGGPTGFGGGGNFGNNTQGQFLNSLGNAFQNQQQSGGGGGLSGLLGTGATALGSFLGGPVGGAIGGGLFSGIQSLLGGDSGSNDNGLGAQAYNPGTYQEALNTLGGATPYNKLDFAPIKEAAVGDFREQGIPSIAARFGGLGSGNSLRGSGFGAALSQGERGLRRDLAAQEQQANLQNFQANDAARLAQQNAALGLLNANRGYGVQQQQLGQNQTLLGQGQQRLGQGQQQLGQSQQQINLQNRLGQAGVQQNQQTFGLQSLQNQQQHNKDLLEAYLSQRKGQYGIPGKPSAFSRIAAPVAHGLGAAAGAYFGGPVGAGIGAGINSLYPKY